MATTKRSAKATTKKKKTGKGVGKGGRPVGERFMKLKCVAELDTLLASGVPLTAVARWLQHEQAECLDMKPNSLRVALWRYRETFDVGEVVEHTLPSMHVKARKRFLDRMSELDRMENVMVRLEYWLAFIDGHATAVSVFDDRILDVGAKIVATAKAMHQIKTELGIAVPQDGYSTKMTESELEEIRQDWGAEAAEVFRDPASRMRILSAYEAIMKAAKFSDDPERVRSFVANMAATDAPAGDA